MTATRRPSALAATVGGPYYPGPSCRNGMPPSDAIAQSLLAFPLDRVPPSACPGVRGLGGNGSNSVGSVRVSIPTRYPDSGSPQPSRHSEASLVVTAGHRAAR